MADVVLDACVLINLVASAVDLSEYADAWSCHFLLASPAADEVLWIEPEEVGREREEVVIEVLAAGGVLEVIELTDEELDHYVTLSRSIGDGEAASLAVAHRRRLVVATDDRRALRLAVALTPQVDILHTAELVRVWAKMSPNNAARLGPALRLIERRANYAPRRGDPLFEWWRSIVDGNP
ncbi:MAG: hypothetical protein ACYCZN_10255 [Candidatus Dormibacteria bacterium]